MWKTCWMHVHFTLRFDFMYLCCVYFVKNCYLLKLQCFLLPFIRCENARFVSKIERNLCATALDWQQAFHRKWMWFNFNPFSRLFFFLPLFHIFRVFPQCHFLWCWQNLCWTQRLFTACARCIIAHYAFRFNAKYTAKMSRGTFHFFISSSK